MNIIQLKFSTKAIIQLKSFEFYSIRKFFIISTSSSTPTIITIIYAMFVKGVV